MNNHFEVIIIGGGPAGSAAAMHLRNYGFEVCLVEKKIFPRETICGEFLSGEVIKQLTGLCLGNKFISLNPNPIKSYKIFFENGKSISGVFDFSAYALKRSVFDLFLLENAKMRGTEVIQPAEVKGIIKDEKKYSVIVDYKGKEINLQSGILIGAYGKQNDLDRILGRPFSRRKTGLVGVKFHLDKKYFNSVNEEQIQIYTGNNIYCGINSVSHYTITLCFLMKKKENISYKDGIIELFNSNNVFQKMLKEEFFESINSQKIYGTGNLFLGSRSKTENGIIMIGDAGGVIPPFTGDGIAMALESAKLAAECLELYKKKRIKYDEALKIYERKWDKLFSRRIRFSGIIQNFLFKDFLKKTASNLAPLINNLPFFASGLVKATRS